MIMLVSSGFVGAMNLIYNFMVVHALGAGRFGHVNAVYTVLLLVASFTLSYQILCSKFVARSGSSGILAELADRWRKKLGFIIFCIAVPGVGR
jgi:hypothetical protein